MKKTIFVLLDACQYEAGTRNLGYLEHLIDYKKGAKYKVKGETSFSFQTYVCNASYRNSGLFPWDYHQ